jgi:hypothetical protein
MKKILSLLFMFVILAAVSYSQIEIKFKEFPKGKLNGEDLWKFDAKNTGKDNLNTVFTLTVTYNDTLLYQASSKNYPIASGETININLKFEEPPLKGWYSNIKKGMIIRENDFLIGDYKICMTAYAANTKNQPDFDKPYGNTCVNHTVDNYEDGAVMEIKPKQPEKGKLTLNDLWNFATTNKSKFKQNVEVYIALTYNGQDMLEGCSRAFSVQPGVTQELAFTWKQSIWNHFKMEPLRDSILSTGIFPPGDYHLCLTVRSEWSKKEFGTNCIDQTVDPIKKDK